MIHVMIVVLILLKWLLKTFNQKCNLFYSINYMHLELDEHDRLDMDGWMA